MIRNFLRLFSGRFVRTTLALFLTAAAWAAWCVLPERPIRSFRFENVSFPLPKLANQSQSIVVSFNPTSDDKLDEPTERASTLDDVVRLIDLKTGRDLIPAKRALFSEVFNNEQYLALYRPNRIIEVYDTSDGQLVSTLAAANADRRTAHIRGAQRGPFLMVCAYGEETIEFWDAGRGVKMQEFSQRRFLDWSAHGGQIALANGHTLTIPNTVTGQEMGTWSSEFVSKPLCTIMNPSGSRIIIVVPVQPTDDRQYQELPSITELEPIVVDPSTRVAIIALPAHAQPTNYGFVGWPQDYQLSQSGRYLTGQDAVWDLQRPIPKNIFNDFTGNGSTVVAPNDSVLIRKDPTPSDTWRLFHYDGSLIASHIGGELQLPLFSADSRWIATVSHRPAPALNWFERMIQTFLRVRINNVGSDVTSIHNASTGKLVHEIPSVSMLKFGINDSLWTINYEQTAVRILVLAQWPIRAPWPAWWVWVPSAALIFVLVNPIVRRFRSQNPKAIAA
jgi:hypothetical protein